MRPKDTTHEDCSPLPGPGHLLPQFDCPHRRHSPATGHQLEISNWSFSDPDTWRALLGGKMLSGESAATLDSARADAADTRSKAHAQANRHNKLLAAGTQPPETRDISKLHLYFQAIENALSGKP
ncbi:MAG: hypothetical protein Ct9H300mP1_13540 [Planctomycetaceae bacterium]|nr:MAG: hypothetical protein Ct9H300mP1_13540 [Planctomycetaceae bacterium]